MAVSNCLPKGLLMKNVMKGGHMIGQDVMTAKDREVEHKKRMKELFTAELINWLFKTAGGKE
jgi:hypothetical protein